MTNCRFAPPPLGFFKPSSERGFCPVLKEVRAKVRMRDIYIEIRGVIPSALLEVLRQEYGTRLLLTAEGFELLRDVWSAPLYEREPEKMKPGDFLRFFRCQADL
jgi:hypothetical protein